MTKKVRVTIKEAIGSTAPTADDLFGQINDFVGLLKDVESAVGPDWSKSLVWRVTDASMNSPISFEFTPSAEIPVEELTIRTVLVQEAALNGLDAMRAGDAKPPYFSGKAINRAKRIHGRVLDGLADTLISVDDGKLAELRIDRNTAREFEASMESALAREAEPYKEMGSIEGFVTKPELDGYNRAILRFRSRLGNKEIKAYASGDAFREVEALTLQEVWHGVRVRVYGTIHYKKLGVVEHINATGIEVLDGIASVDIGNIVDPDFTGGLSTEEFLRELRSDD